MPINAETIINPIKILKTILTLLFKKLKVLSKTYTIVKK